MSLDEYAQARREHNLTIAIATVRDALKPIQLGEIERTNLRPGDTERLAYYSAHARAYTKGKRKVTLKDARRIASQAIADLDRALQKFDESEEQ